jgi:molybdopterin molybdotransferase
VRSVREAIDAILEGVKPLGTEVVPLPDALGRALAEDVVSPVTIPPRTNTAMDGYAARSEDVRGATAEAPRRLRVVEEVHAGRVPERPIGPGEATRVFTGAPVPEGCDGVIRQEDTTRDGAYVLVRSDRDAGRNLRFAGEDLRSGDPVLGAGTSLGAAELGVLASVAKDRVVVGRRARVAILASGDELADLDQREEILSGGKIASSNTYTLEALIRLAGAAPLKLGIARDTLDSVRQLLDRGAREADLVVTTAGVSVGERDFVHEAVRALGGEPAFWRVRMRPGSPLAFGHLGRVPWIGLPGNPVSTMVCFELYVRPAIRRMQGHRALFRPVVAATLEEPVRTAGRLTHFLRAVVRRTETGFTAQLTGPQGSGILTSMVKANALLIVPEDRNEVPAGQTLRALLLAEAWGNTAEPPV